MYKEFMRSALPLPTVQRLVPAPAFRSGLVTKTWETLRHLEAIYPGFRCWFFGKVVPGLDRNDRQIFYKIGNGEFEGIVLAKRARERKLSTVWIAEHARGRGIARELVAEASDWLGTDKPLLTVPQERMTEFKPLLRVLDYQHTEALKGWYRQGKIEHVFNGVLRPETSS